MNFTQEELVAISNHLNSCSDLPVSLTELSEKIKSMLTPVVAEIVAEPIVEAVPVIETPVEANLE